MHSDDDDSESEPPSRSRRVVRELSAGSAGGPTDRLLYRIDGELNAAAFAGSVGEVVERYDGWGLSALDEALGAAAPRGPRRQAFADLVTYQRVDAASEDDFTRHVVELAARDVSSSQSERGGHPFRMRLLRHSPDVHVFSVVFPNAGVDVNVRSAFEAELWQCYDAGVDGRLGVATADKEAEAYWRERFAALPPDPVPAPRHRPAAGGAATLEIRFRFSGEPLQRMREAAQRNGTNEFVWAQCAFADAVFEYCPARAIAIWVPVEPRPAAATPSGQDAPWSSLPLVVERAESPTQLVRAVTREWLSMLRVRRADRDMEPSRDRTDRELPRLGSAGTLRVAYINHAQERMNRPSGRAAAHPAAYAPAVKGETAGVHMLVQSWTAHIGVTLTFNTYWIAEPSARLLARSIESALRTWTESPGEKPRGSRGNGTAPLPEA